MPAKIKLGFQWWLLFHWFLLGAGSAGARKFPVLQLATTIGDGMLAATNEKALIVATDISSDASRLAILYAIAAQPSRVPVYKDLWIAIWDIQSGRLIKRTEVGHSEQESDVFMIGPLDVVFTADRKALVVLGLRQVLLIDPADCSTRAHVEASRSGLGFPCQVLPVSGSTIAITYGGNGKQPYTMIYNTETGKRLAEWSSAIAPQSFSPDAHLAAMPDSANFNKGGVSNLVILNALSGRLVGTLPMRFEYPKSWVGTRNGSGSVVARFLNNREVMVVPDGNRDSAGNHSGEEVDVFDAISGHLERRIPLPRFEPTGTVAESPDRSWLALETICARPLWFSIESTNSSRFAHSLRLLSTDESDSELVVPWPSNQAAVNGQPALSIPPRLSSRGPTAVIVVDGHITVFHAGK